MKKSGPAMLGAIDRSYQDEDDHRTLTRAAEISEDKDRMKGVKRHHRKMKKQMSLVQRNMTGMSRR